MREIASQRLSGSIIGSLRNRAYVHIERVGNPTNRVIAAFDKNEEQRYARQFSAWVKYVPRATQETRVITDDDGFFGACTFYVCDLEIHNTVSPSPSRMLTFHKNNPRLALGKNVFAIWRAAKDQLDRLDDNVFEFDVSPDFMVLHNTVSILNFENFVTITGIRDTQIDQTKKDLDRLQQQGVLTIRSKDALHQAIETSRATTRSVSSAVSRAVEQVNVMGEPDLPLERKKRMCEIIRNLNLSIDISEEHGDITFTVNGDDYQSAIEFLHLLNDDILRSPVTMNFFLSYAKIRLKYAEHGQGRGTTRAAIDKPK